MVTKEILDKLNDNSSIISLSQMSVPMLVDNKIENVNAVVMEVEGTPFFAFGKAEQLLDMGFDNIQYDEKHDAYVGNLFKHADDLVNMATETLNKWAQDHDVCDSVAINGFVRAQMQKELMNHLDNEFGVQPDIKAVEVRRDVWSLYADQHQFYNGIVSVNGRMFDFDYHDGRIVVGKQLNTNMSTLEEKWLSGHMTEVESFIYKSVKEEIAERNNRNRGRFGVTHND
jgi:hypothetical protein